MKTRMEVLSTIIIVVGAVYFQSIAADANSTTPDNYEDEMDTEDAYMYSTSTMMPMTIAWIEKPPYTTSPSNDSLQNDADEPHGLIRDALLQYLVDCSDDDTFFEFLQVDSEFGMLDLLKHNKVQVALPIFEPSNNRRYSKFHFVKIHNYPGIDFISTEDKTNGIDVILDSVKKSWPLLAVTLILTAIAGIIIWGLVGFT